MLEVWVWSASAVLEIVEQSKVQTIFDDYEKRHGRKPQRKDVWPGAITTLVVDDVPALSGGS
jgi:hypothetical protein